MLTFNINYRVYIYIKMDIYKIYKNGIPKNNKPVRNYIR